MRYLLTQVQWKVRSLLPADTPRLRVVQGVPIWMPRSHRLGDFATVAPRYGQNLVDLAKALDPGQPLQFLDVGANIGDSAAQILAARPGKALCIEADSHWLEYLHRNVDGHLAVVAHVLLVSANDRPSPSRRAVRNGQGTTTFVPGQGSGTGNSLLISHLPVDFPEFDHVRLIKSDTDGYDVTLIPELARTYAETRPALFFEYDEKLSVRAGNQRPDEVFPSLSDLGYRHFLAWDNFGVLRGSFDSQSHAQHLEEHRRAVARGEYDYWDVAAAHEDDEAARLALDSHC